MPLHRRGVSTHPGDRDRRPTGRLAELTGRVTQSFRCASIATLRAPNRRTRQAVVWAPYVGFHPLGHYQARPLIQRRWQQLHSGLGSHGHMHNGHRHRTGRREAEAREKCRENDLRLHHCEVRSDADPGASTEGQVLIAVPVCLPFRREVTRIKQVGIIPKMSVAM